MIGNAFPGTYDLGGPPGGQGERGPGGGWDGGHSPPARDGLDEHLSVRVGKALSPRGRK